MTRTLQQLFTLQGKTALVTGGSRGLGLQMAHALGEAGAHVLRQGALRRELVCKKSTRQGKQGASAGEMVAAMRVRWLVKRAGGLQCMPGGTLLPGGLEQLQLSVPAARTHWWRGRRWLGRTGTRARLHIKTVRQM